MTHMFGSRRYATNDNSRNHWLLALNGRTIQNFLSIAPSLPPGNAVYDATLLTPACGTPAPACDSGRLLDGRAQLGPEPHAPNTIGNSCSDGTGGFYHDRSESLDRLAIATLDGSNLAPGKQVRIEANVFAFIPTDDGAAAVGPAVVYPSDDRLDLYLTTNATANPVTWILLTPSSIVPPMAEATPLLSATVTLPATGSSNLWAIRGNYRWSGSQAVCQPRSFDDYDDLVFAVENTGPVNRPPVVDAGADMTVALPASASLAGTVSDDGLPQPPGALTTTWAKLSGPGTVSFSNPNAPVTSATFSAAGSYTLRLTANDGDATASDDVVVTVQAGNNPCAGICNNPTSFTINGRFQSGSLGTGARCYQTTSTIQHGRCSGFASSRTLRLNGINEPCDRSWSTIPAKVAGGYCIQISAGNYSYASFSVW